MSTNQNQPVRQHTVPKLWLKNFLVDNQDRLFAYRRDGTEFAIGLNDATVVKNFYTLRDKNDNPRFDIEIALSKVESDSAPALSKLVNGGVNQISVEQKSQLATFFAIQIKRNIRSRAFYDDAFKAWNTKAHWLAYLDENEERFAKKFSRKEFDDFKSDVQNGRILKNDPNTFLLYSLLNQSERLAQNINRMNWRIEQCKDPNSFFIVGDVPLVVRQPGKWFQPTIVGIEREDLSAELYTPISNKKMLICTWKKRVKANTKVSKFRVAELNKIAVVACHKTVFSPVSSNEIRSLVQSHKKFDIKMGIPILTQKE